MSGSNGKAKRKRKARKRRARVRESRRVVRKPKRELEIDRLLEALRRASGG